MTFLNVFIQLGILFRNVKFYPRVFVNVGFCHISVLLFWPLFIYQINLIDTTRHIYISYPKQNRCFKTYQETTNIVTMSKYSDFYFYLVLLLFSHLFNSKWLIMRISETENRINVNHFENNFNKYDMLQSVPIHSQDSDLNTSLDYTATLVLH